MSAKVLLIVTALIEAGAGIGLLVVPSLISELLLGEGLSSPQGLVVARIAGVALISLAVACWLTRTGQHREQAGLIAGMLIYNFVVPIVLAHAWFASALHGPLLWPGIVLHLALAIWCVTCLRPSRRDG